MGTYSISPSRGQFCPLVQIAGHTCYIKIKSPKRRNMKGLTYGAAVWQMSHISYPDCTDRVRPLRRDTNLANKSEVRKFYEQNTHGISFIIIDDGLRRHFHDRISGRVHVGELLGQSAALVKPIYIS